VATKSTRLRINVDKVLLSRCDSRKAGFATHREALDHAECLMELGRVFPGCHLSPYLCQDCGQFHIHNRRIIFPPLEEERP